jgi:hypothetical protein
MKVYKHESDRIHDRKLSNYFVFIYDNNRRIVFFRDKFVSEEKDDTP